MRDQFEDNDPLPPEDEDLGRSLPRWMSALAVGIAGMLFSALAIYAYRAGVHTVDSGNLTVIEADKTPIKEKPADAGGMQFPNQDKAVFGVLEGKQDAGTEHAAAAPEEPVKREGDTAAAANAASPAAPSGTAGGSNWVNDKLRADNAPTQGSKEMLMAAQTPADKAPADAQLAPAAGGNAADSQPAAEAVPAATPAEPAPAAAAEVTSVNVATSPVAAAVEKKPAKTKKHAAAKKAAAGGHMIQLGAYRSEAEANAAWSHIAAKHSALAGFTPTIQKADLGAKGTYYRLRVGVQNAKIVCGQLSAEKQACLPVQ